MTTSENNREEGNQGNEGSTPDMLELLKSISFVDMDQVTPV